MEKFLVFNALKESDYNIYSMNCWVRPRIIVNQGVHMYICTYVHIMYVCTYVQWAHYDYAVSIQRRDKKNQPKSYRRVYSTKY